MNFFIFILFFFFLADWERSGLRVALAPRKQLVLLKLARQRLAKPRMVNRITFFDCLY